MFISKQLGLTEETLDGDFCACMVENTLDTTDSYYESYKDQDIFLFGDYDLDMGYCGH